MEYVRNIGTDEGLPHWTAFIIVDTREHVLLFSVKNTPEEKYRKIDERAFNRVRRAGHMVRVTCRTLEDALRHESELHELWLEHASAKVKNLESQLAEAESELPLYRASLSAYRNHKIDNALDLE